MQITIPLYPEFRPLELHDKPVFDNAFKSNPPEISEYTFTNLYAWRKAYDLKVSKYGEFLILSCCEVATAFYPPIGPVAGTGEAVKRILLDTRSRFARSGIC
jgi:hypothetical protein